MQKKNEGTEKTNALLLQSLAYSFNFFIKFHLKVD